MLEPLSLCKSLLQMHLSDLSPFLSLLNKLMKYLLSLNKQRNRWWTEGKMFKTILWKPLGSHHSCLQKSSKTLCIKSYLNYMCFVLLKKYVVFQFSFYGDSKLFLNRALIERFSPAVKETCNTFLTNTSSKMHAAASIHLDEEMYTFLWVYEFSE